MPKVLARFESVVKNPRNISLFFAILLIAISRLYWLPGQTFNQQNWDDEIDWIKESSAKSPIEFLFSRDAPGYFIFLPRLIILIGQIYPHAGSISSLRIIVIAAQLLCYAAAVTTVIKWKTNWWLWLTVFTTFSFTYVEDLNYIHNIGYLFIFPIILLIFSRISADQEVRIYHLGVSIFLINKPFTAVLVLFLTILFYVYQRKSRQILLFLGSYSIFYLASYALLPHQLNTPLNMNLATIIKIAIDLPWICIAIVLPSVSIGFMGLSRVFNFTILRDVVGIAAYSLLFVGLWKYRTKIYSDYSRTSILAKGISGSFIINYILVFSASDSYWVKNFPLYRFGSPQFLWMRWSSLLPLLGLLIIGNIPSLTTKTKMCLYLFIASQWALLLAIGNVWFKRYW